MTVAKTTDSWQRPADDSERRFGTETRLQSSRKLEYREWLYREPDALRGRGFDSPRLH